MIHWDILVQLGCLDCQDYKVNVCSEYGPIFYILNMEQTYLHIPLPRSRSLRFRELSNQYFMVSLHAIHERNFDE